MRRKAVPWVILGVVVVALVGLNLSLREDPQPELDEPTPTETPPPEPRRVDVVEQPRPPGRTPDPVAPPDDEEPEGAAAVVGCDHPLIAAEPRQTRMYLWRQSNEDRAAELRLRPRRTRERPSGERVVTWAVQVRAEDDDSELAEAELSTRCVPAQDAEEPWFGILERSLGLELTQDPGRWRWPAELAEGLRFEGSATFDPTNADMRPPDDAVGPQVLRVTRRHVVERRERVEVPAGTFEAWRVSYEERHAFGGRGETGTGTLWVAEGVGLVKSVAENSQGVTQTIELVRGAR